MKSTNLQILIACVVLLPIWVSGCVNGPTPTEIQQLHQQTTAALDVVEAEIVAMQEAQSDLTERLEAMPPGGDRDKLLALSTQAEATLALAEKNRAAIEASVDAVAEAVGDQTGADAAAAALEVTAPAIVSVLGPYGALAVAAGGLLIGGWQRWEKRKADAAGEGVVRAVEAAKAVGATPGASGVVNFDDGNTQAVLSAVMGRDGKSLVDRVQASGKPTA